MEPGGGRPPFMREVVQGDPRECLRPEATTIAQDPEAILFSFVDLSSRKGADIEDWEGKLITTISHRLAERPDPRYLSALRQSAREKNARKRQTIAAAFAYEMKHWAEMKAGPNYNPMVLFRMAMSLAREEADILGETMEVCLERVPLADLWKPFQVGGRAVSADDLPHLADLAYARLEADGDEAKKLLEEAKMELFHPATKSKKWNLFPESFFQAVGGYECNAARFSDQVLTYILTNLQGNDPAFFQEVLAAIETEVARIHARGITVPEDAFQRKLASISYRQESSYRHDHKVLVVLDRLLASLPALRDPYRDRIRARIESERASRERERAEADAARVRDEEAKALERAALDEEHRLHEEERRAVAQRKYDLFLEELPELTVGTEGMGALVPTRVREEDLLSLGQCFTADEWRVVSSPRRAAATLSQLDREVTTLTWENSRGTEYRRLKPAWEVRRTELARSIETALDAKKLLLLEAIDQRLVLADSQPSLVSQGDHIRLLETVRERTRSQIRALGDEQARVRDFLLDVEMIVEHKLRELMPVYEGGQIAQRMQEREQTKTELQQRYLRETIERQTEYLKDLYAAGTGLALAHVDAHAAEESGYVIASVSVRLGFRMSQELRLEQRLKLLTETNVLTLEMGETLDMLKQRRRMVDWVAPHEIAHMIEPVTTLSQQISEADADRAMRTFVAGWRGGMPELATEMIPFVIQETVIDGLGYRLLREHGTSDPGVEASAQRIAVALDGYLVMMDVVQRILETRADLPELRARYAFILLREIAVGELLIADAESTLSLEAREAAERVMGRLRGIFEAYSSETNLFAEGQAEEMMDLCKRFFRATDQVTLTERPQERDRWS